MSSLDQSILNTIYENKTLRFMCENEKHRADSLQDEINRSDLLHYDLCQELKIKISMLENKLRRT